MLVTLRDGVRISFTALKILFCPTPIQLYAVVSDLGSIAVYAVHFMYTLTFRMYVVLFVYTMVLILMMNKK